MYVLYTCACSLVCTICTLTQYQQALIKECVSRLYFVVLVVAAAAAAGVVFAFVAFVVFFFCCC